MCKSVHPHTFQINEPSRCNKFSSLLLYVYSYVQLNIFREIVASAWLIYLKQYFYELFRILLLLWHDLRSTELRMEPETVQL